MDTTIESILDPHQRSHPAISTRFTPHIFKRLRGFALASGLVSLTVYVLARPENTLVLSIAFGLMAVSAFIEFALRWRGLKRAAARQDWRRYGLLQEVIQRLEAGFDVVSPIIPAIELNGQTLVVLRAWSAETGKATLLLDHDGCAIVDEDVWQQSIMLIEFANACLPGVARNRRALIITNQYARNLAAKAWKRAFNDNKDAFKHLGLAADFQIVMEQWESLESFLSLRIALFQAEDNVVKQITVPASDQEEIEAWISAQDRIHQAMKTLDSSAKKISHAAARMLTGWLENKSSLDWERSDELEAGLKFAYLFQSLLLRTLHRWEELVSPDFKTFHRGLELARESGTMITPVR